MATATNNNAANHVPWAHLGIRGGEASTILQGVLPVAVVGDTTIPNAHVSTRIVFDTEFFLL